MEQLDPEDNISTVKGKLEEVKGELVALNNNVNLGHIVSQVNRFPFLTITCKVGVGVAGRVRNLATRLWMKLWVLSPSMRMVTR